MTKLDVTEDEFKSYPQSKQNWIIIRTFDLRFQTVEEDVDKLKKRKWLNTGASGIGGIIGGIIAVVGKSLFWK